METDNGKTVSSELFTVLGNEVIFFEDWETGTIRSMWTAESTAEDGIISATQSVVGIPVAKNGFYGLAMARPVNGNYINTLDLSVPLAAYQGQNVALEFWLRDYDDGTGVNDGIWFK